jgi:peptidoglycan/LPS O-acetylase OafA/YrhL
MGCIVACLASGGMLPSRGWRLGGLRLLALGGFVALIAVRSVENRLLYLGVYSAVEVGAALVVAGVVATTTGWAQRALSLQPLVWLGRISYGLYLWHYPVAEVIGPDDTLSRIEVVLASIALAATTYFVAERPLFALRARLRRVPGDKTSATLPLVLAQPVIDKRVPPPLPAFSTAALAEPIDQPQAPQPGSPGPAGSSTRPPPRIGAFQG